MSALEGVPAVQLRGLSKRFNGLAANDGIHLSVRAGSIHAIIGENGAGKSTAMKMLYGIYAPDAGEILVRGEKKRWRSPSDAIAAGIGMVHQHFMLAGPYTALENILLGDEPSSPSLRWLPRAIRPLWTKGALEKLRRLSEQHGLKVPFDREVEDLSVGVQQRLEILKLLYREASILIFDEPTAVLTPQEVVELFENLRKMAREGKTILIITHKLKEVMALADRVTVFRAGRVVGETDVSQTSTEKLAEVMVGRKVNLTAEKPPEPVLKDLVLDVQDLTLRGARGGEKPRLRGLNFGIRGGEIVGIAGVEGNGQSELLQILLHPNEFAAQASGRFQILGTEALSPEVGLHGNAIRELGVGVIPEDRIREGLLPERDLGENFLLGLQRRFSRKGMISRAAVGEALGRAIKTYDIRPADPSAIVGRLSGGNQQKLIIAREFELSPRFLIAAQPTRGVDVGAIESIHRKILDARAAGTGVLLVSSELDEILALSDRILVMYEGKIAASFKRGECDEKTLGLYMSGAKSV